MLASPPEIGGSGGAYEAGSCLPGGCQRSSGWGGTAGTQAARTPCLPGWVPNVSCSDSPVRLRALVEDVHQVWNAAGRPDWPRLGVAITAQAQTIFADDPGNTIAILATGHADE